MVVTFSNALLSSGSIVLTLIGAHVASWGVRAIRNRDKVAIVGRSRPELRGKMRSFLIVWTSVALAAGASLLASAALLWLTIPLALASGLWPVGLWLLLRMMKIFGQAPRRPAKT